MSDRNHLPSRLFVLSPHFSWNHSKTHNPFFSMLLVLLFCFLEHTAKGGAGFLTQDHSHFFVLIKKTKQSRLLATISLLVFLFVTEQRRRKKPHFTSHLVKTPPHMSLHAINCVIWTRVWDGNNVMWEHVIKWLISNELMPPSFWDTLLPVMLLPVYYAKMTV